MNNLLFNSFHQIPRIWYWEHCTEGMTTESFLRRLKNWEHAGFIESDVWSNMDDIVDSDVNRIDDSISTPDGVENLTEDDTITDRVLSCVSRYIVASRRLQFALEILRLEYQEVETRDAETEMRSNLEVCHQYNVFCASYIVILHKYIIAYIVAPKGKILNSKVETMRLGECRISFKCLFKVCVYLPSDNDALA